MIITVRLYSPLVFPDGVNIKKIEVSENTTLSTLMENLAQQGSFREYGLEGVFSIVDQKEVEANYRLMEGQTVKVFLALAGG